MTVLIHSDLIGWIPFQKFRFFSDLNRSIHDQNAFSFVLTHSFTFEVIPDRSESKPERILRSSRNKIDS